ncbi:glycoside hydrolase family 3 C-terminal domain-containing protein [Angustibacter speluncae]
MTTTDDLAGLVARLDLPTKVRLLTGASAFTLHGAPAIGLHEMAFSDGPTGVRGLRFTGGEAVALFPNATLLSSAWDEDAAREMGEALAEEAERQRIHVVLGPTINLHRTALGGRLFEAYSEDPLLTGRVAAAYVRGMQSRGIAACLKHLVANESETLRNYVDSVVSERALREVYLLPFEIALEDGGAWSVMAAYNDVNGTTATEQAHVNTEVVKDGWGWDGLLMSDWYATKSAGPAANGGLDLVMPGPDGPWGDALLAAVRDGEVAEAVLDDHVTRLLRLAARVGALAGDGRPARAWPATSPAPTDPARRAQLRRLATDGMVVLKNDGVLPLEPSSSVALVGRLALETTCMGGGSAQVTPPHQVSVADGLLEALGGSVVVVDGVPVRARPLPAAPEALTDPVTGKPGARVTYLDADGAEMRTEHVGAAAVGVGFDDDLPRPVAGLVLRGTLVRGGAVRLGAIGTGRWTIRAGGEVVHEAELVAEGYDPGEAVLRPSVSTTDLELADGVEVEARVQVVATEPRPGPDGSLGFLSHVAASGTGLKALVAAPVPPPTGPVLDAAATAAGAADVAVVVVGLTEEQETEAVDKTTLALPGEQDALVEAVARTAARTVVVVNAATPVLMPWYDRVDAVLVVGLPGQEGGHAVADALLGVREPAGRLVTTWPAADGAAPAWDTVPDGLRLEYADDVFVGHRGWVAGRAPAPAHWLGAGEGYGSWEYGQLRLVDPGEPGVRGPRVAVEVRNTSARASREVVQVYLRPDEADRDREPVRLVGFGAARVEAGGSAVVEVATDARLWRRWDDAAGTWGTPLRGGDLLVARGLGDVRSSCPSP